jgi:hypothetical protein
MAAQAMQVTLATLAVGGLVVVGAKELMDVLTRYI